MKSRSRILGPRLRVFLQPDFAIGPGKAEILRGVKETGSIAAAGRRMGMSYKRAWGLVNEMNRHFRAPVVEAAKGGVDGGGAALTEFGETILERYQRMSRRAREAIAEDLEKLMEDLNEDLRKDLSEDTRKRMAREDMGKGSGGGEEPTDKSG